MSRPVCPRCGRWLVGTTVVAPESREHVCRVCAGAERRTGEAYASVPRTVPLWPDHGGWANLVPNPDPAVDDDGTIHPVLDVWFEDRTYAGFVVHSQDGWTGYTPDGRPTPHYPTRTDAGRELVEDLYDQGIITL